MRPSVELDIGEVVGNFPTFRVALVVAVGLAIPVERPASLAAFLTQTEREVAAKLADVELAQIPEIRAWREAYKAFGVKKTSYRSSVERLLKNLQRGAGLPRINALVDLYNGISVLHRMPIGADDLDAVAPLLAFRYARPHDTFIALGEAGMAHDPPKRGEVVYADLTKCLCRRWNWYQDARSAVGTRTKRAVLTVQTLTADAAALTEAINRLVETIAAYTGGRAAWAIADSAQPRIEVDPV
jgi:DNA/RNA-binding domain of Phe-tRNA-synthetase-like protein